MAGVKSLQSLKLQPNVASQVVPRVLYRVLLYFYLMYELID